MAASAGVAAACGTTVWEPWTRMGGALQRRQRQRQPGHRPHRDEQAAVGVWSAWQRALAHSVLPALRRGAEKEQTGEFARLT